MTSKELRQKYLDFFKEKGHSIIAGASLIPENDPSVLFTTAGMHPLVPYLLGENHPAGTRLASAQKCIRTTDIEEVGDSTHHSFFEMMGNWSLGDYFKKEAIEYSWEFLTSPNHLALDKNRLAVSVFAGDDDSPFDEEAYTIWSEIFNKEGLPLTRIAKLPKKNNWWGMDSGGPCGPDTEMFYWSDNEQEAPISFNDDNDSWVEIWNDVFMQYNKKADGSLELLDKKNVDTGFGLERVSSLLNGLSDNYLGDLFLPLIKKIESLSAKQYANNSQDTKSMRIIADHIKAATMIMSDIRGTMPSNTDQGYVVRRLIRRALLEAKKLGIDISNSDWVKELSEIVLDLYKDIYSEIEEKRGLVGLEIKKEADKFQISLEKGLIEFNKISTSDISGVDAFNLYQSFGFPLEITQEMAKEKGIKVDINGFQEELKKHQELSRTAAAGKFKGGLADAGEETVKLHTAAHLLLASLRKVLGDHVSQKGSNITSERLRFDFSHNEKMSPEQIAEVEALVNSAINEDYKVFCEELLLEEAKNRGAVGVFDSKYGEKVKVYTVCKEDGAGNKDITNSFSQEICGGPHVSRTGELGTFKIQKESASSAGVRRIKAVLEKKS